MTFADLKTGDVIFVDANTFIYHFTSHPKFGIACTELLERIETNDLKAFTSAQCLADVAHRIMTTEAMGTFGWPASSLAARLKRRHVEIPKLSLFQAATQKVTQFGILVLPLFDRHVIAATASSLQFELLTGDAMIVAVMREQGLTNIASHDADFDRVPGITRDAPA